MKINLRSATLCQLTAGCLLLLSTSLQAALVGYWNFDTNSLTESSGYRAAGTHDGMPVGRIGYTAGVRGTGGALDLRGTLGAVKVKNSSSNLNPEGNYQDTFSAQLYNSTAGFTIAFWAKELPIGSWQPWISRNGEGSWGYQIRRTDQNFAGFTLRSSDGEDDPSPAGAYTDFSDHRWHHIAAIYNPVTGLRQIYVDGMLQTEVADGNLSKAPGEYLMFGARHPNAWDTNAFDAFSHVALDEIRVYDNALSSVDVQNLVGTPWIYVDSAASVMTAGGANTTVTVTVPESLVATSAVEVTVTSPNPAIVDLVGGTAGVLKLQFPAGGSNIKTYELQAKSSGIVVIQHSSTNTWVDGPKEVIVWPATAPASGLVGYWSFNDDTLVESSGYAPASLHNGTSIGQVAYAQGPSGQGRALALTNANAAVRIDNSGQNDRNVAQTFGNDLYTSPDGFTIAFWARNLPNSDWSAWISKYGEGSYGYQVRKIGGGPSATFTLRSSDGTDDPGTTTADFNDGQWHHVVAVYDPINFQRRLYIDGTAEINTYDGNLDPGSVPGEHLLFGGVEKNSNNPDQGISFGANVYLDEVRIYRKALGDQDVLNVLNSIVATPRTMSLVAPSGNDQLITVTLPPSLVATSTVNVVVSSDNPGVAAPVGATGGNLVLVFAQGGANTRTFAVQANGPGTAHLSYSSAQLPSAAATTIAVSQPNKNGLVAYWNFNSQNLAESSGFQPVGTHDGQAIGNVAYTPGLGGGYALDLRAASTAVRISNTQLSDAGYRNTFDGFLYGSPNGFTFSCWVRGMPQNNWSPWIAKDGETSGYQLRRAGDPTVVGYTIRNSDGDDDATSPTAVIADNLWHHLAAVYDPVMFQRVVYIDGVEQLNTFDGNLTLPPINSALFFGARDLPSGNPFFAGVVLDEVRVYDKALSAAEIATQGGTPMIVLGPGNLNLNVGDADTTTFELRVPATLLATSAVSVIVSSANPAAATPVGAVNGNLTVNFPLGGADTASIPVHAGSIGQTVFTATSAQALVNGEVIINVSPRPQLIGRWFTGLPSLADMSGFQPAGTHDGVLIGSAPDQLAYTTDVPAGFTGQALDLLAGNVAVAIRNSAASDAAYLPTYDTLMTTNFTITFWAKGLPGSWSAWVSKRGDDNIGYQVRRFGGDTRAAFTIRGTPGTDDPSGSMDLADASVWRHFAAVWNGVTGTRQLFIDGVLDTGINLTGDIGPFTTAEGFPLVIGGQANSDGLANQFAGYLFDVRIYNNALSPAGVQRLLAPQIESPVLTVRSTGSQVRISWPAAATGFTLQEASSLGGSWSTSSATVTVEGSEYVAIGAASGTRFYRLIQ